MIFKSLDNALDYGIDECAFWNMTLAELRRLIASKKRIQEEKNKEKASFDYILADMIGRSMSRVFNSSNKMPEISEMYPTIFTNEEIQEKKQEKKMEASAIRFRQFVNSHNKKFNGGGNA